MRIQITHAAQVTEVDLEPGLSTVGGSTADAIQVEGLAASFLLLNVEGTQLHIKAKDTVKVGGAFFPPRVVRLVIPGEIVELPNGARLGFAAAATRAKGSATVAVLRDLFSASSDASTSRAPTLTCVTGLDMARCFVLVDGTNEIGRGEKAKLKIRDRSVSRRHARVVVSQGGCRLEDLGGPNGVFINGRAVRLATLLKDGDVIELGQTVLSFSAAVPEKKATPPESTRSRVTSTASVTERELKIAFQHAEWAIIGLGALLALAGAMLSWRLTV